MPQLKPHHHDLLQKIVAAGGLPADQVDGRVMWPLRALGFVHVSEGRVTVTAAGKDAVSTARAGAVVPKPAGKLSNAQEDLLRSILRNGGIGLDDIDLRTARALRSRGLARESEGMLIGTPAGVAHLESSRQQDTPRRRGRRPRSHPRAEAILKAVEQLEHALPPGAEVLVGPIMCAAEDVTAGFRTLARKLVAESRLRST